MAELRPSQHPSGPNARRVDRAIGSVRIRRGGIVPGRARFVKSGAAVGAIVAGLMLFGLDHIRQFAGKIANEAMPAVTATPEYLAYRKLEVYLAAFEGLYADAQVSGKERATLDRLRVKLGIQPGDALALEAQIREEMAAGAMG